MKQEITFSWQCDFVVVARDGAGKLIRKIDLSEIPKNYPQTKLIRGQKETDKHSIFMYDGQGSVSRATQNEIVQSVETYFKTHDLATFNLFDLWFEICCDHFCGYYCPPD